MKRSLSEKTYNSFYYYYLHFKCGRIPKLLNLKHPTTFNEKTIWLKMNHRYGNAHLLADKVRVKEYVSNVLDAKYLVPTIAVYDRAEDVDFERLPESFVLKANHGSAWNIICRNKAALNIQETRSKLAGWLNSNYYETGKEYQYKDIPPKILCETYLENSPDHPLVDYKVFCFSGEPRYIQVDLDRFTHHTRNFYDLNWNLLPFTTLYPLGRRVLSRPAALDEMLLVARTLSAGMVFARVDLFLFDGRVYFGEITLHHGGGFEPFVPAKYDRVLGEQMHLPIHEHTGNSGSNESIRKNEI
ncbi:MAG: ATP-grasp fold amidoligase family protein [Bacteroidota bacterium]